LVAIHTPGFGPGIFHMKKCAYCGEEKPFSEFPKQPADTRKPTKDGYVSKCFPCGDQARTEREQFLALRKFLYDSVYVQGLENCPCDYRDVRCWWWDYCKKHEVDCENFRVWSTTGKRNQNAKFPDKDFRGRKVNVEL